MVWEGQFEENVFSNPDRFWDTPVTQKWVGSGTLQCPDGFPYPFLMGIGSPGADWFWDSPGYCPLLGPMQDQQIGWLDYNTATSLPCVSPRM